jgi:hypothetical protein
MREARAALDSGALSAAEWRQLVDTGCFSYSRKKTSYSIAIAERLRADGTTSRPSSSELQHDLPLARAFEIAFFRAALDPNEARFTRWLPKNVHDGIHEPIGRGGVFNERWASFLQPDALGNTPSRDAILSFFREMRASYPVRTNP